MPELPEVETIKLGLAKKIIGKTIVSVYVSNKKSFQGIKKDVEERKIIGITRRAKIIQISLNNSKSLLFHLKMTGQLIFIKNHKRVAGGHPSGDWHGELPSKYTRIEFGFDDGAKLFFNDMRKFGWCKVVDQKEIETMFGKFGPEPFSTDFTVDYLMTKAKKLPNRAIKQFLTDQSLVAGIGNIYNDESLFLSKIHPKTKADKLKVKDWQNLIIHIKKVLSLGIKYGGTTDSDYVNAEGKSGGMQNHLNVYHRTGKTCNNNCGKEIMRIKIGGRGTYFCPQCQKEIK